MKKLILLMAASGLMSSGAAIAWESEDGQHSTSASVALSTDYIWRGYSQTDEEAAISGSFDYAHSSGFYAGTWASNVDFDSDASIEVDIYAGFGGEIGDSGIGYDVGVLRYMYPSENELDWNEVYASVSYSYFSFGIAHSGDVYGTSETGTYYSLGFDYELPYGVALGAGYGYYDYDDDVSEDNHQDYRVSLAKDFVGFTFDVSYYGMDDDGEDAYGDLADDRVVFTISKSM